jgi:hypothetical protein
VEFGVEIGVYRGVVRVPRRAFQRLLPERPAPERCVEAYYLLRTRFETLAERKLRRRQLTGDGRSRSAGAQDGRQRAGASPIDRGCVKTISATQPSRPEWLFLPPTSSHSSPRSRLVPR